ncbi:MAG: siroheme synthase [Bacteroidetes bacterium]|nr:MAG: siroheme synthase [Bacteroidota bacterium]
MSNTPGNHVQNEQVETEITPASAGNTLFPVFLKLEQLRLLIVGGGNVALEKLNAVLNNSPAAEITLVAPGIHEEIVQISRHLFNLHIHNRVFREEDLDTADLVIVAVNDIPLAEKIKKAANEKGLLVNVADKPELCDFYLSSVVKKGDLKIAISTNGKSPTLAKRIRELLQEDLPDGTHDLIANLNALRERLRGDFKQKVERLNQVTATLVLPQTSAQKRNKLLKKVAINGLAALALMITGHLLLSYIPLRSIGDAAVSVWSSFDRTILLWILGGFIAGMIDGALGMAYGVSATTFLMSFGISPAVASMSVHASEVFTSGVSGLMHLKFGNVNTKLFRNLLIPGVVGAIVGAYVLSSFEEYNGYIKPFVAAYTLFLGVVIIAKALRKDRVRKKIKRLIPLAATGGFLDSIGGGGWGPIVSSTLIAWGKNPRYTIGSVNLAEFFVALASSFTFATIIGLSHWQVIIGLVIGGTIAAPFAAFLAKKLNVRTAMLLVGVVVIIISLRIMYKSFF